MIIADAFSFSRKTSPCSKGIETNIEGDPITLLFVERHRPARKGLRQRILVDIPTNYSVERHRPARKGLRRAKGNPVIFRFASKDIALLERD